MDSTILPNCPACNHTLPPGSLKCANCGLERRLPRPLADIGAAAGDLIGPYVLKEKLGEGGFGIVWLAGQLEPIQREVALKLIKPGMDSVEIIARFEGERQRLAMMDHPNIASVLDAGTTEAGRPYFVMEVVKGVPITSYCDSKKLDIRERLQLFVPVCQAVQHAHQKAVLHRDLKPSNILVEEVDGKPVPKIIDFGIAKALDASHLDPLRAVFARTQEGAVVGTLQYMSPEQAGSETDVDARSDIYSLGVILYELLTGQTPLPMEHLQRAALDEALRLIREIEPERPSTRVTSAARPSAIVDQIQPDRLKRTLQKDLDWVVLKALEKDRERRYETPTALGLDLERYLNHQPVIAAPPTWHYRLGKFARRNRAALITATLVSVALAAVAVSLVTTAGEQRAIAKARELDGALNQKLRELTASQHAYYWERAQSEQDQGSPRRAIAWLTQALRAQPDDQVSLDALTYLLGEHEWVVPLEKVAYSPEMLQPSKPLGESGVFDGSFGASPGEVRAWVLDWSGVVARSFLWQPGERKWTNEYVSPIAFDTNDYVPETARDMTNTREGLRLQQLPDCWSVEDWMLKLDNGGETIGGEVEVIHSPGRQWALPLGTVERYSSLGFEIRALFDLHKRTMTPVDWPMPVCPVYAWGKPWVCLVRSEERAVEVFDLQKPKEPLDSSWVEELEGDIAAPWRDTAAPGRETYVLTRAAIDTTRRAVYASYTQAVDSKDQLVLWELNPSGQDSLVKVFAGRGAFLPLPVRDVQMPSAERAEGRVLIGNDQEVFICRHTGFEPRKPTETKPAFIEIDYDEEEKLSQGIEATHPKSGKRLRDLGNNAYAVESADGAVISRFRVQYEPGEGGWAYQNFGFSPDGQWVLASGESAGSGDLRAEIFDCASGRRVFPIINMGVNGLTEDGRMAMMADDEVRQLRQLQGSVPIWFLDFIDAITCCRIEKGSLVDMPPVTLTQLHQQFAHELEAPDSRPFKHFLELRFGKE